MLTRSCFPSDNRPHVRMGVERARKNFFSYPILRIVLASFTLGNDHLPFAFDFLRIKCGVCHSLRLDEQSQIQFAFRESFEVGGNVVIGECIISSPFSADKRVYVALPQFSSALERACVRTSAKTRWSPISRFLIPPCKRSTWLRRLKRVWVSELPANHFPD